MRLPQWWWSSFFLRDFREISSVFLFLLCTWNVSSMKLKDFAPALLHTVREKCIHATIILTISVTSKSLLAFQKKCSWHLGMFLLSQVATRKVFKDKEWKNSDFGNHTVLSSVVYGNRSVTALSVEVVMSRVSDASPLFMIVVGMRAANQLLQPATQACIHCQCKWWTNWCHGRK